MFCFSLLNGIVHMLPSLSSGQKTQKVQRSMITSKKRQSGIPKFGWVYISLSAFFQFFTSLSILHHFFSFLSLFCLLFFFFCLYPALYLLYILTFNKSIRNASFMWEWLLLLTIETLASITNHCTNGQRTRLCAFMWGRTCTSCGACAFISTTCQ